MRRPVLIASILALLAACDKPQPVPDVPAVPLTAISATSTILFSVYGDKNDPRIAPIAIVEGNRVSPLVLDAEGWRILDSLFFQPGAKLPIYRNGSDVGTVQVARGMWSDEEGSLYSLPGCTLLRPQAAGRLGATEHVEASVEYLASTTPLKQSTDARPLPRDASAQARTLASTIAEAHEVGQEELAALDFITRWLRTGAGANGRTVLASYIDPNAGDAGPGAGHTVMLLALAEDSAGALSSSYQHVATGNARAVEMQRVVNHADLDADGVDEIVLETWQYAGTPELAILKYAQGKWRLVSRVSQNWCIDATPLKTN